MELAGINADALNRLRKHSNDILYDKTKNTLGDWISDYGGVVNENYTITFGSHFALQKMLDRRDKEVIRIVLDQVFGQDHSDSYGGGVSDGG